jgi:hypothetical protein
LWGSVVVVSYPFSGTAKPMKIWDIAERFKAHMHRGLGICTSRRAARWGDVRHRPKHAAMRLPPAGPPEAHAELYLPQAPTEQNCVSG